MRKHAVPHTASLVYITIRIVNIITRHRNLKYMHKEINKYIKFDFQILSVKYD